MLACAVPVIILPYYCSIGGWVLKYLSAFLTGHGVQAAEDGYFTGYITQVGQPIIWMLIYVLITATVVYKGVNKEIENTVRSDADPVCTDCGNFCIFHYPETYKCRWSDKNRYAGTGDLPDPEF